MDVSIGAKVHCTDRLDGHIAGLVLNPMAMQVTHIIVQEKHVPYAQRLVPIDLIAESFPQHVQLHCTLSELGKMQSFIETVLIDSRTPGYGSTPYLVRSYSMPSAAYIASKVKLVALEHELTPPGELTIHRGTRVEATDGHVGHVSRLLLDSQTGSITHIVFQEEHLWSHKNVIIPISTIQHLEDDAVYLKLDRHSIKILPSISLHER